jgi:hypothetical protein
MPKAPTKTCSTTTRFNLYNPAFAQFMSASILSPVPLVFTSPSHFLIRGPGRNRYPTVSQLPPATVHDPKKKTQKPASTTPNLEIRYRWSQNMSKPEICHRTLRYLGFFQEEPEAWLKLFGKPKVCPQKVDYSNQYHDFKDI